MHSSTSSSAGLEVGLMQMPGEPGRVTTPWHSEDSFGVRSVVTPSRTVVVLDGELDHAATAMLEPALVSARARGRAIDIDCAGLTLVDTAGARRLALAVQEDAWTCLLNVPPRIERILALIAQLPHSGRDGRHEIAIVVHEAMNAGHMNRICDVFHSANQRGCSYEVSTVTLTSPARATRRTPLRAAIVPPMERWMGLSHRDAIVSRLQGLMSGADTVVGIGTGVFLLAAAGILNNRDVVIEPSFAHYLSADVPSARVHCGVAALYDDDVITVSEPDGIESVCATLIEFDYEKQLVL